MPILMSCRFPFNISNVSKKNQFVPFLAFVTCLILLLFMGSCQNRTTNFTFKHNDQGVELLENNKPVFFYQQEPKSLNGEYVCNNYIHPLYGLDGDILTEEFPKDHPYHRGVFWAWHQIYVDGKSIGDGWIMENIKQQVEEVQKSIQKNTAKLELHVLWNSSIFNDSKPFLSENTVITVHPTRNEIRTIDFTIRLKALVPGLEIGGSDDPKGYGGFCMRLKLPNDLTFTSDIGPVLPKVEQVKAGPWMDFSASFGRMGEKRGVSILCHPQTPNYPAPWILRSETSMQNVVFPGNQRVKIPVDKPIALYYRLIIHNGDVTSLNLHKLQKEYEETPVTK